MELVDEMKYFISVFLLCGLMVLEETYGSASKYVFAPGLHKAHSFHASNVCSDTKIGEFETSANNKIVGRWTHPLDSGIIVIKIVDGNLEGLLTGTRGLIDPSKAWLKKFEDRLAVKFIVSQPGGDSCWLRFTLSSIFRKADNQLIRSSANSIVVELEFWQTVKDDDSLEMYQAYLQSYPNGQFASLAISRIEKLTPKPKSEEGKKKDSEIELEFWRSVQDSDDPDLFQAYLDEYPNGHFALIAKIKIKKLR